MIKNALKEKWAKGQGTLNGWLSIGNSFSAEIMAAAGYDSLLIDVQHGFLDYNDAKTMMQALRASGVVPLARVPWNEPGIIMKMLDAGCYGIICPMVNNRAQAEALAQSMRYPPRGARSFGPTRVNFSAGANYASEANDNVLAIAMVETGEAVKNVDEICTTEGIDGVYIGPADLTLGVTNGRLPPGFDRTEPEMVEAIDKILAAAKSAGIYAGIHCGAPEYAAEAIKKGFNFVTLGSDVRLLSAAAGASVADMRKRLGQKAGAEDKNAKGGY